MRKRNRFSRCHNINFNVLNVEIVTTYELMPQLS